MQASRVPAAPAADITFCVSFWVVCFRLDTSFHFTSGLLFIFCVHVCVCLHGVCMCFLCV